MKENKYTFETKCRRCGALHNWNYSGEGPPSFDEFAKTMLRYSNTPHQHNCANCKKGTIHDLISYWSPIK